MVAAGKACWPDALGVYAVKDGKIVQDCFFFGSQSWACGARGAMGASHHRERLGEEIVGAEVT